MKFLNSKQSFDVATKNELAEVINSSWKINPIAVMNTEQQEFLKEIESKTESRVAQLLDSSIDRASPPDELSKWEEGYSDLFEKLKISEQKLFKKIRDAEQTSFRESLNLKTKVAKLEEQLASLQAKIID